MSLLLRGAVCGPILLLLLSTMFADGPQPPIADDQAREELLKKLQDDDPEVTESALHDIRHAKRERKLSVKDRLIELVNHPEPNVRLEAIKRLQEIGPAAADALPVLEQHLFSESPYIRLLAARGVWKIGNLANLAAPVWVDLLQADTLNVEDSDSELWIRKSAAANLQAMGPAAAVELERLIKLADDPRETIRTEATAILGSLGPQYRQQVESKLTAALNDPIPQVRLAAAKGLAEIDAPLDQAIAVLIELANEVVPPSTEAENSVWAEHYIPSLAVEALGQLETDALPAVPMLAKLLKSNVLVVRLEAAAALGRIGPAAKDAVAPLAAALQETEFHSMPFVHQAWCVGENAGKALEQIGMPAVPTLIQSLEDQEPIIRIWAAKALGEIPAAAPQSVGPLTKLLGDTNPKVRVEATKALGNLGEAAVEAAPMLARLLLNEQGVTSFPSGPGIGINESTSKEAWDALLKLKPTAEQVIPPLVAGLRKTDDLSYEAICALRKFPLAAGSAKAPLEHLLKQPKSRVSAASALAFVDPAHGEIETILQEAVFEGEYPDLLASLGLGQLAATGKMFDEDFRSRLQVRVQERPELMLAIALYRMRSDSPQAAGQLVESLRDSHGVFDATALREAEQQLPDLIRRHAPLQQALVQELAYVAKRDNAEDWEWERIYFQHSVRLHAASYLIKANVEVKQAIACLAELANTDDAYAVVEFLAEQPSLPPEAIPILTALLDNNESYTIDGDFYGNGGHVRRVGDRAVIALVRLKAQADLLVKLTSDDARVRERVAEALGQLEDASVINELQPGIEDLNYRVRAATARALGRIGHANPEERERIEPLLRQAREDRRRFVRYEAEAAQATWSTETLPQETTGTGAAKE